MRVQGVSMHTQLVVRRGPRAGHSFPVCDSALTLIGRAPSNHVVLSAPGVSANHCIIAPGPGGQSLNLIDARSKGGVRVNGQPFAKGDLHIGDVVCIGPYEFELALAASGPSEPQPVRPAADRPSRFEFGRPRNGKRLALPAGSATVIGRGKHAHIQLAHDKVSEYHCILALDPTDDACTPFLIDLHSANHTFVNRRAVHRKHVMPGDAIILGRVACELRRIEAATAPRQVRRRVLPRRRKATSLVLPPRPEPEPAAPLKVNPFEAAAAEETAASAAPQAEAQALPQLAVAMVPPASAPQAPPPEPIEEDSPPPAPAPPAAEPLFAPHEPEPPTEELLEPALREPPPAPTPPEPEPPPTPKPSTPRRHATTATVRSPIPPWLTGLSATARALAQKPDDFAAHYGFSCDPFAHEPDPSRFYHSQCHWEAFTTLNRWIETGPPLAVLYGEHGSGKTFLSSCLARRLALIGPNTVIVRPDHETVKRGDLILAAMLAAADHYDEPSPAGRTPLEVWRALIVEIRSRESLFVFLIDDAHEISTDNLRGLAELVQDPTTRGAVRILLAGEERLRDLVATPPLSDHLGIASYLSPMGAEEVGAYVQHRLRLASEHPRDLFTPQALELLATYSGGIPRLINNVADAALYYAYLNRQTEIGPDLVTRAIDELLDK